MNNAIRLTLVTRIDRNEHSSDETPMWEWKNYVIEIDGLR